MKKLCMGEDSTLGTYKKFAILFGDKAVNFIQNKIDNSPNGEDEEVIANEEQMLLLLASFCEKDQIKEETQNHDNTRPIKI